MDPCGAYARAVLHEVGDDLEHETTVGHGTGLGHLADIRAAGHAGELVDRRDAEPAKIDCGLLRLQQVPCEPGGEMQIGDMAAEKQSILARQRKQLHPLLWFERRQRIVVEDLENAGDRGQGCSQLVCHFGQGILGRARLPNTHPPSKARRSCCRADDDDHDRRRRAEQNEEHRGKRTERRTCGQGGR